ncbi:MAG TPA: hypothetical protein VE093_19535 [Polyangiaceae bacterium]|nr:hypothetical protein [Polyangiaceae bacterium]
MKAERMLIDEYQAAVRRVVSTLRAGFGRDDLLRARRTGVIPKDGVISGIEFSFHGIGCRAIVDDVEVDFDFGLDGRADGFDAWRLWLFARQKPKKYPQFQRQEDIKAALERLARSGEIEIPQTESSGYLWYLKS